MSQVCIDFACLHPSPAVITASSVDGKAAVWKGAVQSVLHYSGIGDRPTHRTQCGVQTEVGPYISTCHMPRATDCLNDHISQPKHCSPLARPAPQLVCAAQGVLASP